MSMAKPTRKSAPMADEAKRVMDQAIISHQELWGRRQDGINVTWNASGIPVEQRVSAGRKASKR